MMSNPRPPIPGPANPDPLDITNALDSLAELSASAEFLDLLKEIGNASDAERPAVAARLATVAELKRRGLPVTEETRLTLRYFEDRPGESPTSVITDIVEPVVEDEPIMPADESEELQTEELAGDWTVCGTTGYFTETGLLVCTSLGKKL
jgi:hypothetical protein